MLRLRSLLTMRKVYKLGISNVSIMDDFPRINNVTCEEKVHIVDCSHTEIFYQNVRISYAILNLQYTLI